MKELVSVAVLVKNLKVCMLVWYNQDFEVIIPGKERQFSSG
jgi:hypothetical protein